LIRGSAFQAMKIASYETDLSDPQWHLLRRFLPAAQKRGRPRTALRVVLNAIFYLVKTGEGVGFERSEVTDQGTRTGKSAAPAGWKACPTSLPSARNA
jgi:hypothetical protein